MKAPFARPRVRAALALTVSALLLSACHYHGYGGHHRYGYGEGRSYQGTHGHDGHRYPHRPRFKHGG